MKVIFTLEDTPQGVQVEVYTLGHPAEIAKKTLTANSNTEAERLGEFVQHAIRVWIDTKNLDMHATADYLRSITIRSQKLN